MVVKFLLLTIGKYFWCFDRISFLWQYFNHQFNALSREAGVLGMQIWSFFATKYAHYSLSCKYKSKLLTAWQVPRVLPLRMFSHDLLHKCPSYISSLEHHIIIFTNNYWNQRIDFKGVLNLWFSTKWASWHSHTKPCQYVHNYYV